MRITAVLAFSLVTTAGTALAQPPVPPEPPVFFSLPSFQVPEPPEPPRPAPRPAPRIIIRRGDEGDRAEALYDEARNLIEQGRYDRAVDRFDQLIEMKTTHTDAALYWKAYSLERTGDRAKALATLGEMQKQFAASRWLKDAKALEVELRQASGQAVPPALQNDEDLKLLALRGLIQNDPDQSLPIIEKMLSGSDTPRVKEGALFVLSQSRAPRAHEVMASVAKNPANPELQLRAVTYLGMMNSVENRQLLEDVYKSTSDEAVRRAVLRSLMSSRDQTRLLAIARAESSMALRRRAIDMLGALRAGSELSQLYQSESSPELRKAIIGALFAQQNAAALVALARAEKDPEMKRDIVSRLSLMRTKEATDYLLELLK